MEVSLYQIVALTLKCFSNVYLIFFLCSQDVHGMHKQIRMSPRKLNLVARQVRMY